eukprot:1187811-Prorocentrum_minimum.AAC.2
MKYLGEIFALLCACIAVVVGSPDVGFDGLFRSSTEEVSSWCMQAPIPPHVNGEFIISGPALFEHAGTNFTCVLDAFGKRGDAQVRILQRLHEGRTNRPRMLFTDTEPARKCPLYNPMCHLMASPSMDNNFVNTIKRGNRYSLLTDTPLMLEFDPATMRVTGHRKFSPNAFKMPLLGSAHPVQVAGSNRMVEVVMELSSPDGSSEVVFYTLSDGGERSALKTFRTTNLQYLHSFGVTENFATMPLNIKVDLTKVMPPNPPSLNRALVPDWEGLKVVSLSNSTDEILTFDTEPFFHVHVVNTYENETGLVFDVTSFDEPPFAGPLVSLKEVLNKTARDSMTNLGTVRRLVLHFTGDKKGEVTTEDLSVRGRSTDFPTINPRFVGLPYCVYYATEWKHDDVSYATMAVVKHNICRGTRTYWHRKSWYPSEAVFVLQPSDELTLNSQEVEDDDWGNVIFVALNGRTGLSHFVMLDARTFTEVVNVELPLRIPFTAHGEYFQK